MMTHEAKQAKSQRATGSALFHTPVSVGSASFSSVHKALRVSSTSDSLEAEAKNQADISLPYGHAYNARPVISRASTNTESTTQPWPDAYVNKVVTRGLSNYGNPLDPATREPMEKHFGHDLSTVRVHDTTEAANSARRLNAHAYTVGENMVFGTGRYAPQMARGNKLLAHELTHVLQQRASAVNMVQRDVIDDVRENMSYSIIDWAVTDSEANDSLALLATIPELDLPAALTRLGSKYVNRLIDNLPDAAKSGEVYQRVITALGSAGTIGFATDQLSYGIVDWAVSNDEVARVFNIFTTLPEAQRENFLLELNQTGMLERLVDNASYGQITMHLQPWMNSLVRGRLNSQQRAIMLSIVKKAPTDPIDIVQLATEIRFNVSIGPTTSPTRTPSAWSGDKLRGTYLALDDLPEAHVARNRELTQFTHFTQAPRTLTNGSTATVSGFYSSARQELSLNARAGDNYAGVLIHETGHAVDSEMGWSTGTEPAKHSRGGWNTYANHNACATDMVADSNGGITTALDAVQRANVISNMATAMTNRSANALSSSISAWPWFTTLTRRDQSDVLHDDAIEAIPIGLQSPWFTATDGGKHLGNHVYQESYTPTWVRYRHEARTRMVAKYQFRDEGEWFAECYEAYYDEGNNVIGDRLNRKDPNTKTYFDNFVHTRAVTR